MKVLYKPFALIFTVFAARMGKGVFHSLWSRIDSEDPPKATSPEASLSKVMGAAALEAATMATVGAAANRASARAFEYLTGVWPGDSGEKKKKKKRRRPGRRKDRGD